MAIIANYPTSYIHADRSGVVTDILNGHKYVPVANGTSGGTTLFEPCELLAPWMADTADMQNCAAVIFIVNDTGCTLTLDGTPYYDGGTLISQPVLPDGTTVNVIPAGFTTDRGTYLGFGRFVQDDGSMFYGSGIAMTLRATQGGFSQSFGLFVAGSVQGGYGLDVCADMATVDPKTRFDNLAGKQTTPLGHLCEDRQGGLHVHAVILCRIPSAQKQFGDAAPLVIARVTG
jgi:hypothetical protein